MAAPAPTAAEAAEAELIRAQLCDRAAALIRALDVPTSKATRNLLEAHTAPVTTLAWIFDKVPIGANARYEKRLDSVSGSDRKCGSQYARIKFTRPNGQLVLEWEELEREYLGPARRLVERLAHLDRVPNCRRVRALKVLGEPQPQPQPATAEDLQALYQEYQAQHQPEPQHQEFPPLPTVEELQALNLEFILPEPEEPTGVEPAEEPILPPYAMSPPQPQPVPLGLEVELSNMSLGSFAFSAGAVDRYLAGEEATSQAAAAEAFYIGETAYDPITLLPIVGF